jgi:predicted helicase
MLLTDTGYVPTKEQRLRVFLTNSLEEPHADSGTLWGNLLSEEADQANEVKRDTPVMCVIGNPPYSGISSNNGKWISDLIDDYKYVDGVHFNERKHWLNDDYVKFLRYGQHFIEKNGQGILAFINPHGFLDNPTFRGMRWHLIKTFDKIYTIDLHGNSTKKETCPDGSPDVNVFDIMQGVSINIFVKNGKKKISELGKVFHFDLYGKREMKYDFLIEKSLNTIEFKELGYNNPNYFFIPKNDDGRNEYEKGFRVDELFAKNVTGIVSMGDEFAFSESKSELVQRINEFRNTDISENDLKVKFNLGKNYAEFILKNKEQLKIDDDKFIKCSYRPFDDRYTYFDNKILWRWRVDIMQHFIKGKNVGLAIGRQGVVTGSPYWDVLSITNNIMDFNYYRRGGEVVFPLYLYPDNKGQQTIDQSDERTPNLNTEIVNQIAEKVGLTFTNEKETTKDTFAPIDILDYIYAVLHSPNYREKYKEFLKIDFPRVPYPKDQDTFWKLVKLGGEIRQIHLLESPVVDKPISKYPETGTNIVEKPKYENGKVMINETQYFEDVPEVAWNFYIGGYQPAQKWLKDRKDRELQIDDIRHYMKIIVALTETDRLMKEVDKIEIE